MNETKKPGKLIMFLKGFFINYCWVGIIVLLTIIIIDLKIQEQTLVIKIIIELVKTVGISIIIASIFSWATDSNAFIERIQQLLKSVVVDRDFLTGLDPQKKSEVLKLLIKPSSFEKSIYTNIDDYYNHYIKQTLDISETNVRSDYRIDAKAYYSTQKKRVMCEKTVSYRLYPNHKGYESVKIGFTKEVEGKVEYIRICNQTGKIEEHKNLKLTPTELDGEEMEFCMVELKEYTIKDSHLIIEFKTIESSFDHWYMAAIQTLQPTDGICYKIRCEDGIKVKTVDTFGQAVNFKIEKNEHDATVSTYQWLNSGAGICVIVSKDINSTNKPSIEKKN